MGTVVATIITGMVALCLGLWIVRGVRLDSVRKQRFQSREPMPVREWLGRLVESAEYERAEAVLLRLANTIRIDPMKLRPEDLIYGKPHSIAEFCGDCDDIDEAFWDECDRFGRNANDGKNIRTITDYILFFASS